MSETDFDAAVAYSVAREGITFLLMRREQIVFESYARGCDANTANEIGSGTKSFSGVMAAAAVQDGLLTLDEPCANTISAWRSDPARKKITIRNLLSLESGLEAGRVGEPTTYESALSAAVECEAGTKFRYGPIPFAIFGAILQRKLAAHGRNPNPLAYLRERVLDPEGMAIGGWQAGEDGNPLLQNTARFTAREWAKFGRFVLRGGNGRVDPAALRDNFRVSKANPGYALTWWLLRPGVIGVGTIMPIYAAADLLRFDIRMSAGGGDQRMYLVPAHDLLVVRQAAPALRHNGPPYSDADFMRLVLQGLGLY